MDFVAFHDLLIALTVLKRIFINLKLFLSCKFNAFSPQSKTTKNPPIESLYPTIKFRLFRFFS